MNEVFFFCKRKMPIHGTWYNKCQITLNNPLKFLFLEFSIKIFYRFLQFLGTLGKHWESSKIIKKQLFFIQFEDQVWFYKIGKSGQKSLKNWSFYWLRLKRLYITFFHPLTLVFQFEKYLPWFRSRTLQKMKIVFCF